MKTVGELGEDALIKALCSPLPTSNDVVVGPGDDCAVVGRGKVLTLLKTDAVVAGVHFLPDEKAKRVGWKAIARVLSDFAAMGGKPAELLVTIALSPDTTVAWVEELYQGMTACLQKHGGVIVGGETTSLPKGAPVMISVAGRGCVEKSQLVTRSTGQAGDSIYVTGSLGGSIRGKHLDFTPRIIEADWLTKNFQITAMMDLSDGLAKDLPRLARMSGCGFRIDQQSLPLTEGSAVENALNDGEDYELLFTSNADIEKSWKTDFPDLPLTKIGELTREKESELEGGWDHFNH
jgi:thiamine-monophosphate kinase